MYVYVYKCMYMHFIYCCVIILSFSKLYRSVHIAYCLCTPQNDYESKLAILENDRLDKTVNSLLSPSEKEDVYKNGMYVCTVQALHMCCVFDGHISVETSSKVLTRMAF